MTRFPSKVDWWLGAILVAVIPVSMLLSAYTAFRAGQTGMAVASVAFVIVLYVGLVFPMYYELERDSLVIRFGLMRSRIPYSAIKAVSPTRNPLSSPALSLDRLHVDCDRNWGRGVNISPKEKQRFLEELAKRAPHLELAGDRLRSSPRNRA